jgi:hypothetical protein
VTDTPTPDQSPDEQTDADQRDALKAVMDAEPWTDGVDPDRLRAALADFWAAVPDAERRDAPPLREATGQRTAPGMENPYFDLMLDVPARDRWGRYAYSLPVVFGASFELSYRIMAAGGDMFRPRLRYSWSVPTPSDLTLLTELCRDRGVVEIGAGGGYWAWMLTQCGVDVAAYDIAPGRTRWFTGTPWHDVAQAGPQAAAEHPGKALMLCWPMEDDPVAAQALDAYRGDTLIFIGDPASCGDGAFWQQVKRGWDEQLCAVDHYPYWGLRDLLSIFRKA